MHVTSLADDFVLQRARARGWLGEEQYERARVALGKFLPGAEIFETSGARLVAEGLLTAGQLTRLLAEELDVEAVSLAEFHPTEELRALVPPALARRYQFLPLALHDHKLRIAVSDPLDGETADAIRDQLGLPVEACMATAEDIARALDRAYAPVTEPGHGWRAGLDDSVAESAEMDRAVSSATARSREDDAPVVSLVHELIREAVRRRASDIHLEPMARRLRVRYRIDGVLQEAEDPPKRLQPAIISRLKLMARISIAEKRIPQDGRMQVPLAGRLLDLRVSSLPTTHGESLVLRLLDQPDQSLALAELGMHPEDLTLLERLLVQPNGLVLVTGPTGSGKTTTLYSCLQHLNRPDRKIITVEDPVERQLSGINQVPVRPEAGVTFGSALRAMLRQSPDTIMIGEIRDLETAEIALQAALTGHLVFSTLHTNDAAGAVARLADLGVKPFLLTVALRAVLAQRLVRKVCPNCRRPRVAGAAETAALNLSPAQVEIAAFASGTGCIACAGTGYRGRTGIFELLVVEDEISQMIHERAGVDGLRMAARAKGRRTLREDGARKAIAGLTTIEEVVSITVGDACQPNHPDPP